MEAFGLIGQMEVFHKMEVPHSWEQYMALRKKLKILFEFKMMRLRTGLGSLLLLQLPSSFVVVVVDVAYGIVDCCWVFLCHNHQPQRNSGIKLTS
jgi:hypothetical protein